MYEYEAVEIRRPLHDVFRFMADFENDPQWRAELLGIQLVDGRPDEAGARYLQSVQWEGRSVESVFEVSSVDPDCSIEVGGSSDGVEVTVLYEFEPVNDDVTKVIIRANAETHGPLYVLEPFLHGLVTKQLDEDLESLRTLLNAEAESFVEHAKAST